MTALLAIAAGTVAGLLAGLWLRTREAPDWSEEARKSLERNIMNYDEWDDIVESVWNLRPGWISDRREQLKKAKEILAKLVEEAKQEDKS